MDTSKVQPPPWQAPTVSIKVKLPDGQVVDTSGTFDEAWNWFFLQIRDVLQNAGDLAELNFALLNKTEKSYAQSVSGRSDAALRSLNARVASLESQLGAAVAVAQSLSMQVRGLTQARAASDLAALANNKDKSLASSVAAASGLASLAFTAAGRRQPSPTFLLIQDTLANQPAATDYADGMVLFYATDTEEMYVIQAGAWVQVMAFLSFNPGTNTLTFTGNVHLAGTHAQDVGTGDSPTFTKVTSADYSVGATPGISISSSPLVSASSSSGTFLVSVSTSTTTISYTTGLTTATFVDGISTSTSSALTGIGTVTSSEVFTKGLRTT